VFTLAGLGPKRAEMRIIGCDWHARQQTLAVLAATTTEVMEKIRRRFKQTNHGSRNMTGEMRT
jgi:hypothetical protein